MVGTASPKPAAEDSFFADFDLCPSLEELLNDPLLSGDEWPVIDSPPGGRSTTCGSQEASQQTVLSVITTSEEGQCQAQDTGGKADITSVGRDRSPEDSSSEHTNEDEKRFKRMLRNRESAALSRERKRQAITEKDKLISELEARVSQVAALSNHLAKENVALRQHICSLCQRFGEPAPQNILSYPPLLASNGQPVPSTEQCCNQPSDRKVPIERLPINRPVPADASTRRPPKRRKQQVVAGGTTVLAGLFCLFIFWSPMSPDRMSTTEGSSAFKDSSLSQHGRILQAAEGIQDSRSQWLAELSNTSKTPTIQPTDLDTETRALQHLREIGPVAILSKYDTRADQFSSPAPWKSLASLANVALARDGFSKATECKKEFSVDIAEVKDRDVAYRELQQYMLQANTFRGRKHALALPPVGQELSASNEEESDLPNRRKDKIGCNHEEDDYIISVMMPTREQLEGYTSLSKLYIVVLNPNKRYTTYSCGLERPIMI